MRSWMGILLLLWIILPAPLFAQNACGNAPAPRLQAGMNVTVTPGQSNNLRQSPSASAARIGQISSGMVVTVLDGPVCADGFYWYEVEHGSISGWTVEGSGAEYWLAETDEVPNTPETPPQAAAADCPKARLFVGGQGIVIPGNVNRVRREATTSSEQVGQIFGGVVFDIQDGFVCAGGYNWWHVRLGSIEGWTVEGDASDYFVEPFNDPDRVQRATANSLSWSPDGRWLAAGSDIGNWVFDAEDFDTPPKRVGRPANSVFFKPDGVPVIGPTISGDWHSFLPSSSDFSPNDVLVVALRLLDNREYGFSFYNAATGELINTMLTGWEGGGHGRPPPDPSYQAVVYAAQPGRYVYIQGTSGYADLAPPQPTIVLSRISPESRTVAVQPLPQFTYAIVLYDTDEGGRVGIHELRPPRIPGDLTPVPVGENLDAASIALSPDGRHFSIGAADGRVQQWAFPARQLLVETALSDRSVQRMTYAPDGDLLAAAAHDTLYILEAHHLEILARQEIGSPIVDIAYNPDASVLAVLTSRELWLLDAGSYAVRHHFALN